MRVSEFFIVNVTSDKLRGGIVSNRNGKAVLRFEAERAYGGFFEGEFSEEVELRGEMESLLTELKRAARSPVKEVYLGVPGEFTTAVVRNTKLLFPSPKRVTDKDADAVLFRDKMANRNADYLTVNGSPISYATESEKGLKTVVGKTTSALYCKASYVLAEKIFTDLFDTVAADNNVKFVYVSSILSEINYVLTEEQRDGNGAGSIFADVGFASSTLAVAEGDGILYQISFPYGEGLIAGGLSEGCEIPFEHALSLVRKLNFNLEYGEDDVFSVADGGKIFRYRMGDVLENAYAGVKTLCGYLAESLSRANVEIPNAEEPIYLTGSSFLTAEGVAELIENEIGRPVRLVFSENPEFLECDATSFAGLAELAARSERKPFRLADLFTRT